MRQFKNILLAAGGESWEKIAVKRAVSLAEHNGARLEIADVIEELPHEMRRLYAAVPLVKLQKRAVAERRKQLQEIIAPYRRRGLQVSARVLVGKPFVEIIREVIRNSHDLVIATAEETTGLKARLYGTTATKLMRKCPCPVWIVKSAKKYSRILAAVDIGSTSRVEKALNAMIMELAEFLAKREGSELHIVHAWTLHTERMLIMRGGLDYGDVERLGRSVQSERADRLKELLDKYAPGTPAQRIHLVKGDAGSVIPAIAKRKQIDLIVMGTLSRSGIAGVFMGNTAEKILNQVDCSVLTVKPRGFVSPVRLS